MSCNALKTRLGRLAGAYIDTHALYVPKPEFRLRRYSQSRFSLQPLPVHISAQGTGTIQTVLVKDKPYKISIDAYESLGGTESHPSPIVYSLASLSSCNQVTGFIVARDHGIKIGDWHIEAEGQLPTTVFVGGAEGSPNWKSVVLKVRVQTDIKKENNAFGFSQYVAEVERRCPMTALFKQSGVAYTSEWVNEPFTKNETDRQ